MIVVHLFRRAVVLLAGRNRAYSFLTPRSPCVPIRQEAISAADGRSLPMPPSRPCLPTVSTLSLSSGVVMPRVKPPLSTAPSISCSCPLIRLHYLLTVDF